MGYGLLWADARQRNERDENGGSYALHGVLLSGVKAGAIILPLLCSGPQLKKQHIQSWRLTNDLSEPTSGTVDARPSIVDR